MIDAYFWIKPPGESDGCTRLLPTGKECAHYDRACGLPNAIGSNASEPRAPEANEYFEAQAKLLAKHAFFGRTWDVPEPQLYPDLFCFSVMRPHPPELDLIKLQFKKRASIFACNDFAVISKARLLLGEIKGRGKIWTWKQKLPKANYGSTSNGATTSSFLNTQVFIKAWDALMESGVVWKHDWTVKVDPDAVFFPDRLRKHVKDVTGSATYIVNCNKYGPMLYGSLEALSLEAVRTYRRGQYACKSMDVGIMGEDGYMQTCLTKLLGVNATEDWMQVGDNRCTYAPCSDGTRAAYHPFKDRWSWQACYEQAVR